MKSWSIIGVAFLLFLLPFQEQKIKDNEGGQSDYLESPFKSFGSNPIWKTITFSNFGSLKIPMDFLKVYSTLNIQKETPDTIFAKIPDGGFLVNHKNSVGGKDFFQIVFSLSDATSNELKEFQYDWNKISNDEKEKIKRLFSDDILNAYENSPHFAGLDMVSIFPFDNKIGVKTIYRRKSTHEKNESTVHSEMLIFPLKKHIGTILIEFYQEEAHIWEQYCSEIWKSFRPLIQ